MKNPNILQKVRGEHDPVLTGCCGHPLMQKLNLDHLAAKGTRVENAYCNNHVGAPILHLLP